MQLFESWCAHLWMVANANSIYALVIPNEDSERFNNLNLLGWDKNTVLKGIFCGVALVCYFGAHLSHWREPSFIELIISTLFCGHFLGVKFFTNGVPATSHFVVALRFVCRCVCGMQYSICVTRAVKLKLFAHGFIYFFATMPRLQKYSVLCMCVLERRLDKSKETIIENKWK